MAFRVVFTPDGQRHLVFVGDRCLALNGVSAAAVMASPRLIYDMILPEHQAVFRTTEARAVAAGEPFDVEVAMRRPDGQVRWHRIASIPRPQPDGSVYWDGLQIDITDRREIEEELVEQRRRLEIAVEATGLGLWERDVRHDTVVWSDRNRELFGVAPGVPVDMALVMSRVHPEDRERVARVMGGARDTPGGGDFSMEHRVLGADGQTRWLLTHGRVLTDELGPTLMLGTSRDITTRKEAEERRDLLVQELGHRAKNGIQVMSAMVAQTARTATSVEDLTARLLARFEAMAKSQDLVTAAAGGPVPVSDLLAQVLGAFDTGRFDIDDEVNDLSVAGDTAIALALLLHELSTNAVKYGAFARTGGRVAITRADAPEGHAAMVWRETGGPEVTPPTHRGFGTRLLDLALRSGGGSVTPSYAPQGFSAQLDFPTGR